MVRTLYDDGIDAWLMACAGLVATAVFGLAATRSGFVALQVTAVCGAACVCDRGFDDPRLYSRIIVGVFLLYTAECI